MGIELGFIPQEKKTSMPLTITMVRKSLLLSIIFPYIITLVLFITIHVIIEIFFPPTVYSYKEFEVFTLYVKLGETVGLQLLAIIAGVIVGWAIRRRYIKLNLDEKERVLKDMLIIFIPTAFVFAVINIVFYAIKFGNFVANVFAIIYEYIQFISFSALIGALFYNSIEKTLGPLFFKEKLLADRNKLGLGFAEEQIKITMGRQGTSGMLLIAVLLQVANFLVFLFYPSIPTSKYPDVSLSFVFPNFKYYFDPALGFRQEIFVLYAVPSALLVNWKLVQSILCLLFVGVTTLLIISKIRMKTSTDNNTTNDEISASNSAVSPYKIDETNNTDKMVYNLLHPSVEPDYYTPKHIIPRVERFRFLSYLRDSNVLPVIKLTLVNFGLSIIVILLLEAFGAPVSTVVADLEKDIDKSFITLSLLYWAGFSEELTFRFLLMGLPLFLIWCLRAVLVLTKSRIFTKVDGKNTASPSRYNIRFGVKYLIGGWAPSISDLSLLDWIFLIFSSFAFGYVHYQFGWQAGKIVQAGIGGMIMGYAYIRYGLHASIFIHTVTDFTIGLIITYNLGFALQGNVIIYAFYILGLLYLIVTSFQLADYLIARLNKLLRGKVSSPNLGEENK